MVTLHTIGHSTRTAEEFLALVETSGIELVADVRRHPVSQRHPHFERARIEAALASRGVRYRHFEALGGHRAPSPASRNTGVGDDALRGYADHTATRAFAEAIERLLTEARACRVAVLCAEASPRDCHRRILSDWLAFHGHEIVHVLGPDASEAHVPYAGLARDERGHVVWRARQAGLFDA